MFERTLRLRRERGRDGFALGHLGGVNKLRARTPASSLHVSLNQTLPWNREAAGVSASFGHATRCITRGETDLADAALTIRASPFADGGARLRLLAWAVQRQGFRLGASVDQRSSLADQSRNSE